MLSEKQEARVVAQASERTLISASHDWVDLAEIQSEVIQASADYGSHVWYRDMRRATAALTTPGISDPWFETRLSRAMSVVGGTVSDGLLVPGTVLDGFQQWDGTPQDWLKRIEHEWRRIGTRLRIGDVCWFSLTEGGTKRVSELL